jgi:hypothetical protein
MNRQLQATALFLGTSLVAAVTVSGLLLAGWSGGRLDNRIEPLFWAGAIITAAAIALFGAAAFPRRDDARGEASVVRLIQIGIVLFVAGPVLCIVAVFGAYWI